MPLGGIGTYVPTMQEFEAHWTSVNAVGLPDLFLAGNFSLANFTTLIGTVDTAITNAINLQNTQTNLTGDRDTSRAANRERLRQFRSAVNGILPGSRYVRSLPKLYHPSATQGQVLASLDDMLNLWTAVNANVPPYPGFVPPLLLASAYAIATFTTDLTAFRALYGSLGAAAQNAQQARASRDVTLRDARNRLLQYRQAVISFLPPGHALLDTIPAVTPPPGSTPDPVVANGDWNAVTELGDLIWTESTNPDLDFYSIRGCAGATYSSATETTLGTVAAGDPREFSTAFALVASGSVATFRVYVVLTTGNEKGSNTVRIDRP